MPLIREARDTDAPRIIEIFTQCYGHSYPFKGFYDVEWIKKAVYDDGTIFLVMEMDGQVIATASMMLTSGGLDDMIGEFGRLVATTDEKYRGKGLFNELFEELEKMASTRALFMFGEARSVHRGSQKILQKLNWTPCGYEPHKYLVSGRECMIMYAKSHPMAKELRRNNPRIIPEASILACKVLSNMDFPVDAIVDSENEGYPIDGAFQVEHLKGQRGISTLLRIERGRVTEKEIFGNFSLSSGFFRISDHKTDYLIAKENDVILGAIGFVFDEIDKKIKIFEIIDFNDRVKGHLLKCLVDVATTEYNVEYIEADVSAYSPKMQRTLERLGFIPICYCPSMVFDKVERLDVIRMAKINCKYDPGEARFLDGAREIKEIVEKSMDNKLVGMEVTMAVSKTDLFIDIPDGEAYKLARISTMETCEEGSYLVRSGEKPRYLYILEDGEAKVLEGGKEIDTLTSGSLIGEMSVFDKEPHTADVCLSRKSNVIKIEIDRLERVMEEHTSLGFDVTRNMARSISRRYRKSREVK